MLSLDWILWRRGTGKTEETEEEPHGGTVGTEPLT
jgi:hypothetical protein